MMQAHLQLGQHLPVMMGIAIALAIAEAIVISIDCTCAILQCACADILIYSYACIVSIIMIITARSLDSTIYK